MSLEFRRPVGANRDLKELEYISALQQTQPGDLRSDGSIRDVDISMFLSSRYGVNVTPAEVTENLLPGLAGTHAEVLADFAKKKESSNKKGGSDKEKEESAGGTIDLAELVSVLLMPALVKIASSSKDRPAANNDDKGKCEAKLSIDIAEPIDDETTKETKLGGVVRTSRLVWCIV